MKKDNDLKENNLLMPEEAAQVLRISPRTLAKWRSTGENNIPYVKVGKSVRYRPADIQNHIDSHIKHAGEN